MSNNEAAVVQVVQLVLNAQELWELQNVAEAEILLLQALELAEKSLGTEHPQVSMILSHLAWLALSRERYKESIAFFRRALAIGESAFGPNHPNTLHLLEELADALFAAKEPEKSDALAMRAIVGYQAAGRDDVELADLIAKVACRRAWAGRLAEAETLYQLALSMKEQLLGPSDVSTAEIAGRLALICDRCESDVNPEPFYRQSLDGYVKGLSNQHSEVFKACYRLASYLDRQGRQEEASPLFDQLIATLGARSSIIDPEEFHYILIDCIQFLHKTNRKPEAETLENSGRLYNAYVVTCKKKSAQVEAAFGSDSLEFADAIDILTGAYTSAAQLEEAQESSRRALAIRKFRLGSNDPRTIESHARLARIADNVASYAAIKKYEYAWRDSRKSDLIHVYLLAITFGDTSIEAIAAELAMFQLTFNADLDEQWEVIRELIAEAPDKDSVLQTIAEILELFLARFDEQVVNQVEVQAERDVKFRRILSRVSKHRMSEPVWDRIRLIQLTESNP